MSGPNNTHFIVGIELERMTRLMSRAFVEDTDKVVDRMIASEFTPEAVDAMIRKAVRDRFEAELVEAVRRCVSAYMAGHAAEIARVATEEARKMLADKKQTRRWKR